jgi:hypothetical protein
MKEESITSAAEEVPPLVIGVLKGYILSISAVVTMPSLTTTLVEGCVLILLVLVLDPLSTSLEPTEASSPVDSCRTYHGSKRHHRSRRCSIPFNSFFSLHLLIARSFN